MISTTNIMMISESSGARGGFFTPNKLRFLFHQFLPGMLLLCFISLWWGGGGRTVNARYVSATNAEVDSSSV